MLAARDRQLVETFKTRGNEPGATGKHPIDPSEHGILFMDRIGDAHRLGGRQRGKGWIAPETGNDIGLPALDDGACLGQPLGELEAGFGQL